MLIKNLKHLTELCKGRTQLDCFVWLGGILRSSKTLLLESDGEVNVINEIDDSEEHFTSLEHMTKKHTTIRRALKGKAFFVYSYELKGG
jgi:hypothetical protein